MSGATTLPAIPLPPGIRSRIVEGINGLSMHVLEAGFESKGRPCVLLLHGFPELAFSWRKVMPALAEAGYHVIAPDQRGYGRTTGWDARYEGDLNSFRLTNLVRDALGLVSAFGYRSVASVVGHDFGSSVAAWCALIRPDVFRSVVLMSAPFAGAPQLAFDTADAPPQLKREDPVHRELAALPRPRKHYHWYYSTREANADMWHAPQGVHDFLRAYFHHKSADWKDNKPYPLQSWSAGELAKLPTYYVMDLASNMAETVAAEMPSAEAIAANQWLPDRELAFYSAEYERTGFQGGLQWYRCEAGSPRSSKPGPGAASMCLPASSRARRTGAPISAPASSRRCRRAPAPACSAVIWSTAPGTGCSRSSLARLAACCCSFLNRRRIRRLVNYSRP
jgi:pimeloyl-ACP methyl ester carboxylesterase